MENDVTIWTEGGAALGMGHIVRCINIAGELRKSNLKPSFIINEDESSGKRLLKEGFPFIINSFGEDFTQDSLDTLRASKVVVIDTKKDVSKLVKLFKAKGIKVVLIDNTTDGAQLSDLVIIPSILPVEPNSLKEKENLFFGPEHLILGETFIDAHRGQSTHPHGLPLRVLVTFGGADPNALTLKVVKALSAMIDLDITVVIGDAFTERDPYAYTAACKHVHCVSGLTDLAPLMSENDVAFTANGTSIYELAFMGVPSLVIGNYETDVKEMEAYQEFGFSLSLGLFSELTAQMIQTALKRFFDKEYFETCSKKASDLTDGHGAKRAAELIVSLHDSKEDEEDQSI